MKDRAGASLFASLLLAGGCFGSSLADSRPAASSNKESQGGAGGATVPPAGGAGGALGTGDAQAVADGGSTTGTLPCDVQTLLAARCESCHGSTTAGGAPRSLVTYADLTKPDPANAAMTEAQVSLGRMQSTPAPMPPSPASAATAAEIATLQNWINAGYPSGSCAVDAGTSAPDPLQAAPTCTSNTTWTKQTTGSASMEPGQACITCHAATGGDAPTFVVAGTLYPTWHEPDNCDGVNGTTAGAKIVVTGQNGGSLTITPNAAGNFYSLASLTPPYQAKVVNGSGVERAMVSSTGSGDCNSCHTQTGTNGAPGRIVVP